MRTITTILLCISLLAGCKKKDDNNNVQPAPSTVCPNTSDWAATLSYTIGIDNISVNDAYIDWGSVGKDCSFWLEGYGLSRAFDLAILNTVYGPGTYNIPAYKPSNMSFPGEGVIVTHNGESYVNRNTLHQALVIDSLQRQPIVMNGTFEFPLTNVNDDMDTIWVTNGYFGD